MQINLPPKIRLAVYVLVGVGNLVLIYLNARGIVGADEVKLWQGLSAFAAGLAAINVSK